MESLTQTVATIYKKLVIHLNKDELREDVNRQLLDTLKDSATEEEYKENLLRSIVIHVESTKALHAIIQPLLAEANYPRLDGVSELMKRANARIEKEAENLIPLYLKRAEEEGAPNDIVTQLEIYFTTTLVELKMTYSFIDAFGTESNQELFMPFFSFPAEEVGESILKYTRTYASLLFEKNFSQH